MKSAEYDSDLFDGRIVLIGGVDEKETGGIQIVDIKGSGEEAENAVVKCIGAIDAVGMFYGTNESLSLEEIIVLERKDDELNIALIVWEGGMRYLNGVQIILMGRKTNAVVMNISGSSYSKRNDTSVLNGTRSGGISMEGGALSLSLIVLSPIVFGLRTSQVLKTTSHALEGDRLQ